jgi:hypothetical protein
VGTCATAIAAEAAMMKAVYFILTLVQVQDVVAGEDCSGEVDGSERLMLTTVVLTKENPEALVFRKVDFECG